MTQEEKAKAYDEAIEKGKQILNTPYTAHWDIMKEIVEHLIPELKENEDEKIRKMLIEQMKRWHECAIENNVVQDIKDSEYAIAWLEKQCEQKPADKVEPKFKVGDIIKPKCYNETHSIKAIGERYYILDVDIKIPFRDEDDWELVGQKSSWSEEDEDNMMMIEDRLSDYLDYIREDTSLTKQQKNSMKEEVVGYVNWFKSLKERYTWKPSDEQMIALKHASNDCSVAFADMKILETLYEQLKALHRYGQDT